VVREIVRGRGAHTKVTATANVKAARPK
jgi:hypothetical protein